VACLLTDLSLFLVFTGAGSTLLVEIQYSTVLVVSTVITSTSVVQVVPVYYLRFGFSSTGTSPILVLVL
jgi:hypothetical protein